MKILLTQPGKLNTVPMGRFSGDALRNLGHEVVDFDLSSNWLDKSIDWLSRDERHRHLNKRFKRLVDAERPDLMFAVFGFDLAPDTLEYLKSRGIPRACWWLGAVHAWWWTGRWTFRTSSTATKKSSLTATRMN